MTNITTDIRISPETFKPGVFTEAEINFSLESKDDALYWAECIIEVPHPLSLAPDKKLFIGKTLVGIIGQGNRREKRLKLYSDSSIHPSVYQVKLIFYLYGADGAIEDRKEVFKSIECGEINAKVL